MPFRCAAFSRENVGCDKGELALIEKEYELEEKRKDQEIKTRLAEIEREQEVSKAILIRNGSLTGFVFVFIIAIILFQGVKRKNAANAKLNALNGELKSAHNEISLINETLEDRIRDRTALLEEKNRKLKKYMHSNSHIVRAPLARILGLTELYKPQTEEEVDLDFICTNINSSANELDVILRKINEVLAED